MTNLDLRFDPELSWKSWSAITLFGFGFLGLVVGVDVSDRPGMPEADLLVLSHFLIFVN